MGDNSDDGENFCDPYLLINVLPKTTGEKPEREIVPASLIKKFNYKIYKINRNIFKETKFNFRRGPGGQKQKCHVLYAGDNYQDVYAKSLSKRFPIPTHSTTLDETRENSDNNNDKNVGNQENEDNNGNDEQNDENDKNDDNVKRKQILSNNKRKLKQINVQKKKKITDRENDVLHEYMNQQQSGDETDIEEPSFLTQKTSTPIMNITNVSKDKEAFAQISKQANRYKNLYIAKRRENEDLKNMLREHQLTDPDHHVVDAQDINNLSTPRLRRNYDEKDSSSSKIDPFLHYDDIYSYQQDQSIKYDEFGNVLLAHGIPCNPKAYNDSWKTKSPSKCLAILSQGVYELQDLAERCVRKQSNTKQRKKLDPLKTIALEKQVYKFMRIKNLQIDDVEYFLRNLNTVHNQCITKARRRCETLKSLNVELSEEEEIDYRGPLNE
ncbi:hypothetical protein TSAR_003291 [Trichomalopsis sarcophagae]|uniref:BEN domain-containing protein n=1 Tax=Trichomalopsis sarcophagae TaxID=543379 RepID=A0A232EE50_9HYME|nr:hypothetical protein TSAR_003291 [Trichomalopsis sarcophagae]